jgi:hypothetical protein
MHTLNLQAPPRQLNYLSPTTYPSSCQTSPFGKSRRAFLDTSVCLVPANHHLGCRTVSRPLHIRHGKSSRSSPVAIASTDPVTGGLDSSPSSGKSKPAPLSGLTARVIFGVLLGAAGAAVILAGGWVFTAATCLVVYQASQEFYGFVTSKGISKGMQPPPPVVSSLTSLLCIGITLWTFATNGRVTAALAVTSFALLSLQLLAVDKPRFSQLASSVFGLFYCGESHLF